MSRPRPSHPWRRLLSRLSRVAATQLDALAFLEREQAAVLAPQRVLDLESLERRILLNAVPAGVIDQPAVIQTLDVAVTDTAAAATTQSAAANPPPSAAAEAETTARHELVVIESGIENFDSLLDELRRSEQPGTSREILVLDSDDGVDTVTAELHRGTTYDAVHLLVHGSERAIRFGGEWLLFDGSGGNASLAVWRAGLAPGADLLFYSCDTASAPAGQDWLARVAQETGADVAASTDNTGAASLGGNWTLEYQLGAIDTPSLATTANVEPWHGLLATFTVTTASDTLLGSLRTAITTANLLPGTDTITFSIGSGAKTLSLGSLLPTITDSLIIDGTSQPGYSGSPLITIDGSGITGDGLTLASSGSTVQGLVISGFTGNGIVLSGSGGHTIQGNWIGLNASGTGVLANSADGIAINSGSNGNVIGGALSSQRNIIAGNGDDGISVRSSNNAILGNWIGLTPAGTPLGNTGDGISIEGSAGANTIGGVTTGQSNRISFNGGRGVSVAGSSNVGIVIRGNDLSGNTGLGIDLGANGITVNDLGDVDTGANQLVNKPILFDATPFTSSTTIRGTFTGAANTAVTIDFYAATTPGSVTNPQANKYLGSTSVTTDAYGVATFSTSVATAVGYNQALTATATVSGSGTSELATPVPATPPWNKLYWIDSTNNTLERADLDNTNRQTLISGLSAAHAAAIDPRAGFIYYVDQSPDRIRRVSLNGSGGTTIYTAASGTLSSLAIDSLNGHLYYTNVDNGIVGRINLDGSNDTTIVTLTGPTALALSEGLGAIFYSDQTTVYRRDLLSGSTTTLASGIGQVHALAVEEASGQLYFTDFANGSIQRVGIDGTGLTTLVSGENNPTALAVDPRRNVLYWAVDQNNRIRSSDLNGNGAANWENSVPFADNLFFASTSGNDSNPTTTGLSNVTVTQGAGPSTISLQSAFSDLESGAAGLSYRLVGNTNGNLFQSVFLDQASSTLRLTYDSGQSGTSTLTVRATDGDGRSVDASFVVLVNTAPTITTIAARQMGPGATLGPIAFTVGDGQISAGSLVVTATSSSQSRIHDANIVLGGSGANRTVTLTSAGNAPAGTATITLTVSDGNLTAQSQFVVTIQTGTPAATADSYTMAEDGVLSIPAGGVLTNDTDPQGNTLTAILVGGPAHAASFTLNANGSFSYTPVANYFGTDTFTYRAFNGTNQSSTQTATITISAVNDLPIISAIADQTIDEDTRTGWLTFTLQDVDSPIENLSVTASSSNTAIIPASAIELGGSLANRTIRITPPANASGDPVTVTLFVSDGTGTAQATFRVTVRPVNDDPTLVAPAFVTTAEDVPVSISVTVGDVETDPDQLIVLATSSNQKVIPDSGLVFSGTGTNRTLTIHPAANQYGSPIHVTLTVSDGTATSVQSVIVRVTPVNDPVQALGFPDLLVDEDSRNPVVDLKQGFADVETSSFRLQYAVLDNSNPALISSTQIASNGLLTLQLAPDASGSATLTIQARDPEGTTAVGKLLVVVNPVNDAPRFGSLVFSPDSLLTSTISGNILAQITEVDGQPITLRLLSGPARGTLIFDASTGLFSYTPGTTYAPTDSFTVEASDGTLATVGTVTLNTPIRVSAVGSANSSTASVTSTSTGGTTGATTAGSTTVSTSSASSGTTNTTSAATVTTTSPSSNTTIAVVPTALILISPTTASATPVGLPIVMATASPAMSTGPVTGDLAKASFGIGPGQILAGPLPTNAVMSSTATASDGDDNSVSVWVNSHSASTSPLSLQGNSPRATVSVEIRGSMLREWTMSSTRFTEEYLLPEIDSLSLSYQSVQPLAQSNELHSELAKVENDLAESFKSDTLVAGSAVAVTSGLSVGYVIWLVRSGLIMTSLLAQVPAWQDIDPLTVLDSSGGQDEDGESLQSLVDTTDDNDLTLT